MKRTLSPLYRAEYAEMYAPVTAHRGLAATFFPPLLLKWLIWMAISLLSAFSMKAQAPQVVKDIYGQATLHSQSTTGYNFKGFNGYVYFSADDGINSFELWKSNGTEAGTVMVKDINPGSGASNAQLFIEMNGVLYFVATSAANGQELWKTDGTEAGTVLVKDIFPGTGGSSPQNLFVFNNTLYFTAQNATTVGRELWRSDGTDAGTLLVKDINAGSVSSAPASFINVNGTLVFTATTAANGLELWKTDGTNAGTVLLKDINPGATTSTATLLAVTPTKAFFIANDGTNGFEIWKTDGTEAGTVLVKDITAGSGSTSFSSYTSDGTLLYFTASGSLGTELWKTDGTDAGTSMLKDINPGANSSTPQNFLVIANTLYFTATDGVSGIELWKSNGTEESTVMVKDINAGTQSSSPILLTNVNGTLYFSGQEAATGRELWKSDGTSAGTVIVKDLNAGTASTTPGSLTNVSGQLFFTGSAGGLFSLIKSDGTDAGTSPLNTSVVGGGAFASLFAYQGKLFFMYNGLRAGVPSTATGREPWVSDGTDAGTKLIKDINSTTDQANPGPYCKIGNLFYFAAADGINGTELWKSDGTEAGTVMVKDISTGTTSSGPQNFVNINGVLYFTASNNAAGRELWKSDGTEAGTVMVKDIWPGNSGGTPTLLTVLNGTLFFIANTQTEGSALWKSDGTDAGTVMVADIVAGASPSPNIQQLTAAGNNVFFIANITGFGVELWKTDGTQAGTVMVKDIFPGTTSSSPDDLIAYNGRVYFSATDGTNGREPWVSDGTPAGTTMFVNIATSGSFPNSNPQNFAVAGGKLYFTAFTASTSFEPWVSDGTPVNTYMITEIVEGGSGSSPNNFVSLNGTTYFAASASGFGRELWKTDGTAVGTVQVKDIVTGTGSSSPDMLTVVGNTIYFRAVSPNGDIEFYKSDGTDAGTVLYDLYPGATTSNPDFFTPFNDALIFTATHPVNGRELWKAVASPAPSPSFSIAGDTSVCVNNTVIYTAVNVVGENITYHWSLPGGGGTLIANGNTATVTWSVEGAKTIALFLSNSNGSTPSKQRTVNVISGGIPPTQAPIVTVFARTLSASNFPNGTYCQWYRNGAAITGANQPTYYAAEAGTYTARFVSICATGPESNSVNFGNAATAQTITFNTIPDIQLTPTAKIALQASASSGLPVFYQKLLGPGFIQNDTLYITGAGTLTGDIVIKAMQPGNEIFSPAEEIQQTIRVLRGNQVISFDSIPDMIFGPQQFQLTGSSSSGLAVTYSIVSGNAFASIVSSTKLKLTGAGTVTVRASQIGNFNYLSATPVDRTFCIGVRTIGNISGDNNPCLNTYRYLAQNIPGANYQWTLSGGGTITTNKDTAWITWQTPGNYSLKVKVNSACDPSFSDEVEMPIVTSSNAPSPVTNMTPADNSIDQQLPLRLSWVPGTNTNRYDLYVWKAQDPQPATPLVANLETIFYTLPANSLQHNTTYKWRVVSKNPCSQTPGPIQEFNIIPLPDLVVSDVQAPASAISGQTITVSWKVTNAGPGRTAPNATWYDGVYFALDTTVSFQGSPNWNPTSWNSLTAAGRPLLLGKKIRPSSLDSGQSYTNSIDFTLPLSYSFPVYIYVITDNEHPNWKIQQVTVVNDTARKPGTMAIQLAPTPDLRVDSVFTSASTFSGSVINLTYKVKNYGILTPSGSNWVDSIFISQNPLFDRNNAIPLKVPKSNGSYYPNALDAAVSNSTQIMADSFYTRSTNVVIPNFVFGTWFIYVKTNAKKTGNNILYEGAFSENNLNRAQIQVYLSPTPKLTVNTLNVPVTNASTTQPIGINWNIRNEGFIDNLEINKGHHFRREGNCPCAVSKPNTICYGPARYLDSLGLGSSYWVDRVYLSTDPNGLNVNNAVLLSEVKQGTQFMSGLLHPDIYEPCGIGGGGDAVNVSHALYPNANFPQSLNFKVPSNLLPGSYYVYVYTNPTKTVFEYPGTPQIRRSELPIVVQRPDVSVSAISVPGNTTGGQPVVIDYTLLNTGSGAVFNHIRRDRIYISSSPTFNASAQLIGTSTFTEDLPIGAGVAHSFTYRMPAATSGTRYFFVVTNYDSAFSETNYVNNLSPAAATTVSAAVPADLVVSNVQVADSIFTVYASRIIYTVSNSGSGIATGTWNDSVFISCSPVYNPATSYFIGRKTQSRSLNSLANYTDTLNLTMKYSFEINNCFTAASYGNAYFFVKANADTGVYEGSAVNNNVGGSGNRTLVNPLVDHIVTNVSGANATSVGSTYTLNWRIKNIGFNPEKLQYYYTWYDMIYFSADSIADGGDIKASEVYRYITLDRNQDSGFSKSFYIPYMPTGEYYVYVHNNPTDRIFGEKILTNNINFIRDASGAAKKIQVISPLLSDLRDSIVAAPAVVDAGQPITVIYKITNTGSGITLPGTNFQNQLFLSSDFAVVPNDGDRLLASRNRTSALLPGQSFLDTVTVTVPATTLPGSYVLISEANSNDAVIESNKLNNLGFSLITVVSPPETDLIVSGMKMPDTVILGYTIDTAKWVVKNVSGEQARGKSKDGIYLAKANAIDSNAVLIGIKDKNLLMQPNQEDTVRLAPLVTGVIEGNYNVLVKTDLLGNITESEKDNNIGVSSKPVYVKARELKMNVDEPNTLGDTSRFYKLKIPDSLYGSTILVTLRTPDSLSVRNELFIAAGYVPTAARYDYRYEVASFGNQQIVLSEVTDSVYYIMYRCASNNAPLQHVQLKAVKLPFAILNVHTNAGGNIGNVTIRIRGSLFNDSMTAKLSNAGTTIHASKVYYTNSTEVYATFPLKGKPLGIYDVTLTKTDQSQAVMPNGFSIVPANNGGIISGGGSNTGSGDGNEPGCDPGAASGLNAQLVIELVVPSRVLTDRPVVILINYTNPTNYDVPVQSRILFSDEDVKMAFTKAGVPTGSTSLYIEFKGDGGPPGFIRPGGGGTITVYCRSPKEVPADSSVLFKIK